MTRLVVFVWTLGLFILSISWAAAETNPRIQVLGDSLMATNGIAGRSIPDVLSKVLDAEVDNHAAMGAMMRSVAGQYEPGPYDWVVFNGGGNDLWLGCGCTRCDRRMDKLIRADGLAGHIPRLADRAMKDGSKVLIVGYLRSPGFGSPIEHCRDAGDELERRIGELARKIDGVYLLSNQDLVPDGDTSFHAFDRVHPSFKGSQAIAQRIARVIQSIP